MMYYGASECDVQLFDRVELHTEEDVFDGQIIRLHPRLEAATVRIHDHVNCRRDGEPRCRTVKVSVIDIDLVARDG